MNNHKNLLIRFATLFVLTVFTLPAFADGGLNAYYKVGDFSGSMREAETAVKTALGTPEKPFKIIGTYNPAKDRKLTVIAFSRQDLIDICLKVGNKAILASVMKIGLRETAPNKIEVSLLNPDYIFYAYLRESFEKYQIELSPISMDVRIALINIGHQFMPFGGAAQVMELQRFRFAPSWPNFEEPVTIREFSSYDQAITTIEKNLRQRKSGATKVYGQVFRDKKLAIYGVGLTDQRMGESKFLPQLGKENLAALPYELVIDGKKAMILHARYRLPLFWVDKPLRTHQRLYKTPRDITEVMKTITK